LRELKAKGIRAELDLRNEKINYKVREHSLQKVPYLFVVGKREAEERNVAIRQLGSDQQKVINLEVAIDDLAIAAQPPY
jgi:threonyl-tRNA synthetase